VLSAINSHLSGLRYIILVRVLAADALGHPAMSIDYTTMFGKGMISIKSISLLDGLKTFVILLDLLKHEK
jgi:hypothetical protein